MNLTKTEVETKMGRAFCTFTFATAEDAKAFKMFAAKEVGFSHWYITRTKNVVRTDAVGFQVGCNKGSY